jgi:hypothetical protein
MFKRGISDEFVQALRNWPHWGRIVKEGQLFIAVRDKSINIYFQGCSLFKVSYYKEKLVVETHYKYLVRPDLKKPYVRWDGENPLVGDLADKILMDKFDVGSLKRSSRWYAAPEKAGLHRILMSNSNIVDVEVALSHESAGEEGGADPLTKGKRVADRIDFAAIQKRDGRPCVVFFEAKRFDNGELRSQIHKPPVIEQTEKYKDFIEKHLPDFKKSYGTVCSNLVELGLNRIHPIVLEVARKPEQLEVVPDVRLVVYDFDQDQNDGKVWKEHKAILHNHFRDRLLLKGSPTEFTSGISEWDSKVAA